MKILFHWKRLTGLVAVLLVSLIVNYFFSFSHEYLIPLAALCMMFTSIGSYVTQGLQRYLLIVLGVAAYSYFFSSHELLYFRIYDVTIGCAIGIIVNVLVFPRKADAEFRKAILPILIAYENYFTAVIDLFLGKEVSYIESQQIELELQLQQFPFWIYQERFDFRLQTGYRYFLGKMQHVAEILFAMHYTVRQRPDIKIVKKIRAPLLECVTRLQYLFKAMITVFELKKITEGVEDCQAELYELETKLQALMPNYLELIDLPNDFSRIYEFIYGLKDLRFALMKLAQALR